MEKLAYFLSDLHLGAKYIKSPLDHERRVVRWLDSIKETASEIYLLGDILDYWYEYKYVVPRGFTRFLGKLAELSDSGVKIYWFIGNHDIWIFDYLPKEIGITVIDGYLIQEIKGKNFFLSHGDGVGEHKFSFRLIRNIFRNKFCQFLFSSIHPRWTIPFAHRWSSHSRTSHCEIPQYKGEDDEYLFRFAKENNKSSNIHIDHYVFGHRHVLIQESIGENCQITILGDWIKLFSFASFDGKTMKIDCFKD